MFLEYALDTLNLERFSLSVLNPFNHLFPKVSKMDWKIPYMPNSKLNMLQDTHKKVFFSQDLESLI